ncbi:MAG: C25 family cysteine peptidase, partial [Candidatus Methanoperedens sp.]|nr:C25 family cysteine peptidase [Candidatus Methanoperedens sp.]
MRTPTAVSRSCRRLLLILAALSLVPARHGASAEARLIVVVPDALRPSLDGWLEHKRSKLAVEVASLETILRESPGVDDPERLKRFLHAARRQSAGKQDPPAAAAAADPYVLHVGDADVLPVRYMVLDRVTPAAQDYAFYPSDLYYADVAKPDGSFEDWNARKDGFHAGYFGEVRGEKNKEGPINFDGIDYLPELAVGRWPASTPEEVATIAAKSLAYERGLLDGKKPGARRAAFVAVGGWVDSRGLFDRLADSLPAGWTAEKRYFGGGRRGPRAAGPGPSADEVVKILSEGAGLVCHAGHGQDDRWEQSLGIA